MAISEDTAALVAAQLTVAWATRVGVSKAQTSPASDAIMHRYTQYLADLRPSGPAGYDIDKLT